jgi:hypothetical protein
MKIQGQKVVAPPKEEIVVIPRDGGDLIFKACMIESYEDFDKLCPRPEPPSKMIKGGKQQSFPDDPKYLERLHKWAANRAHWMFIKSLEPSEIEWETVDLSNPDTWENYQTEMEESGLSQIEQIRVMQIIQDANGLNQSKIDEATERFLAGQQEQVESESSQKDELKTTPSGVPAKGSE